MLQSRSSPVPSRRNGAYQLAKRRGMSPTVAKPGKALVNAHRKHELPDYVAGLLRPEAYEHPAEDLALHDTHIS